MEKWEMALGLPAVPHEGVLHRNVVGASPSVLKAMPGPDFVETPFIREVTNRSLDYLKAGFAVHFSGPAGSGKTTLAMHLASQLGRPIMFISGDDQFSSADLVGGSLGYRRRRVVDRFIHSVLKTEDDMRIQWVDNRLTIACQEGMTLLYDEFNRSRPEANNVLLSVLEEGILVFPGHGRAGATQLKVHPDFRAIFTSNPNEYAGTHKAQSALLDRMITIDLHHFDRETEVAITQRKADISRQDAERVVDLVRAIREQFQNQNANIRRCIMLGRALRLSGALPRRSDPRFIKACLDILGSLNGDRDGLLTLVERFCPDMPAAPVPSPPLSPSPIAPGEGEGGEGKGEAVVQLSANKDVGGGWLE